MLRGDGALLEPALRQSGDVGRAPDYVGPTTVASADGTEAASERTILAIGEAKTGERISERHLRRLEAARVGLGRRAKEAKVLLFGADFTPELVSDGVKRTDVELVDLERMYAGG